MKKLPEIIPANKSLKINFYILIASYLFVLLSLDSIINYFLLFDVNKSNITLISELSEKKAFITHIAHGMLRVLPMIMLAWFGYRILSSAQLPPARMALPFAVPLQKGRKAKIMGLFIISLALLFVAQNIAYVSQQLVKL